MTRLTCRAPFCVLATSLALALPASQVSAEVADAVYRDGVLFLWNTMSNWHAGITYCYDNALGAKHVIHSKGSSNYEPNSVAVGTWTQFLNGKNYVGSTCPAQLSKAVRDALISDALDQLNAHYFAWGPITWGWMHPNSSPGSGDGIFRCDGLVEWCYEQNGYDLCNDVDLYGPFSPCGPYLQFWSVPDAIETCPYNVTMTYPSSQNPNSPTISSSSSVTLQATGADTHSGLAFNEPFTYWYSYYDGSAWSAWAEIDTGDGSLNVTVAANTLFAICVQAFDNGGNYTVSSAYYLKYAPPPSKATNPSPANGASGQSINTDLSWQNGGGATSYTVFFGTSSIISNNSWHSGVTSTTFDPGPLTPGTTYYWWILSTGTGGTTEGDMWRFTTGQPPQKPMTPTPADGAANQSTSPTLSWQNGGGATSYNVILSTSPVVTNAMVYSCWGTQNTVAHPGPLQPNTTYYWEVISMNDVGWAEGDVWSFTTAGLSYQLVSTAAPNGTAFPVGTFLLDAGASTTIVYQAFEWYRIGELLVNGAPVADAVGTKQYVWTVSDVAQNYSNCIAFVRATARQTGYPTNIPTSWLAKWGYTEAAMSNHWDNDALDVLREYWLDTDPTVSNDVRFCTSGVAVSNGTVSVRVKLLVDNWRMTALNGGTVVQVQTKTNLQDAAWRRTADLPVDGGTFDVNGEAVVRTNLSDRSLFLRAVVSP